MTEIGCGMETEVTERNEDEGGERDESVIHSAARSQQAEARTYTRDAAREV